MPALTTPLSFKGGSSQRMPPRYSATSSETAATNPDRIPILLCRRGETESLLYLYLRYRFTGILILVSIATIGTSVDLNMTVRDLRDIPRK
jgi:hypothetical protein